MLETLSFIYLVAKGNLYWITPINQKKGAELRTKGGTMS